MLIQFDIPDELAQQFASQPGAHTRRAEPLTMEGVRSGKLTEYQARQLLRISSRYEIAAYALSF